MKRIIIIGGKGQIGSAITKIEKEAKNRVIIIDLNHKNILASNSHIMHICIPYDNNFEDAVCSYISEHAPNLTLIHSTISLGVTERIKQKTKKHIVHTPCMGIHPNLYEGLKTFTKIVGGDADSINLARTHLNSIGIKVKCFSSSRESELCKILDTGYYAWNILFSKLVKNTCKKEKLNFNEVYKMTNELYNNGYQLLGKHNVIRPILYPPPTEGLSGHCIIENALILHELNNDPASLISLPILKLGKSTKKTEKYKDRVWLACEYLGKNKTLHEIAEKCNVSTHIIKKWLKKLDVPKKGEHPYTVEEKILLEELSQEMSFKEIADSLLLKRSYHSIKKQAQKMNISSAFNYKLTKETKKKISCTLRDIELDDFVDYAINETQRKRSSSRYFKWRTAVFKRDDYTCQNKNCEFCKNKKGGILNAHHIKHWKDYEKLRFDVDNGITYCCDYHLKTGLHKNGD